MKHIKLLVYLILAVFLTSCLKNEDTTLVLPKVIYAIPLNQVIPDTLISKINEQMQIYSGSVPPNIIGVYLVHPCVLTYTSDPQNFSIGYVFTDDVISFSNQNAFTNVISYKEIEGELSNQYSNDVSVSGSNNNFTAYFIESGTSNGIADTTAVLISGTKTPLGIQNYQEAFVMLNKGPDPNQILMDIGTFRIVSDGDSLASNTTWPSQALQPHVKSLSEFKCTTMSKRSNTH